MAGRLRLDDVRTPDPRLGLIPLDDWVGRLVETCPHAAGLTAEHVRDVLRERGVDLSHWDDGVPVSWFQVVLQVLAPEQSEWVFHSDRKGARDQAAGVFERWLSLPPHTVATDGLLDDVADRANQAARERGTTDAFVELLPPPGDDHVFVRLTPELRDALIANRVLQPTSAVDHQLRGEAPLSLDASTPLHQLDVLANDAHNLLENAGIETVGQLLATRARDRRGWRRAPVGVVEHIEDVLRRGGARLRAL